MQALLEALKKTKAYYCIECGKCTGLCPISRVDHSYSPRLLLIRTILNANEELLKDNRLWTCLTCKLCEERCPSDVDYIELTKSLRVAAHGAGHEGECTHGGALQSLMRIMTSPQLNQNRLDWLTSDLKINTQGEILYFVGCSPYFDIFFSDLDAHTLDAAKGTIKILNAVGIQPVLLPDERCCGHDLLWTGDLENFSRLAEYNIEKIKKSGAKQVIFSCPECYRTFKADYPLYFGDLGFDSIHISEFMAEKISSGQLNFSNFKEKVTFQDPCRLGRHLGVYDEPREVMKAIPGLELNEMRRIRNLAICCGASTWMNCTSYSKLIQVKRLREAKATGADFLITACPKCEIHLKCAMSDKKLGDEIKMDIRDLTTLAAQQIK